ncbi:MAG TPA: 5-methyltetrahydropteroyltriglutamate--homocysteine S-methyltransferase, partial [Pirellulales bacterium]|nr:5-methyltetrahydropteroyltriglutamate--homocysteine S-methyltransferase [Pirellulales bacterium]
KDRTMATLKPPYRAEQVGSLPRPERLMVAREDFAAGKISRAELTQIEDESIRVAVAMQERVGIGAITDGEFRKRGWREFLYDKCGGFGPDTVERDFPFTTFEGTVVPPRPEPKIMTKLARREPLSANDFSALQKMTRKQIKANLPTPSVTHCFIGDAAFDRGAYADRVQLMDDLARIMREEIADLASRGCTYLQMDEVPLAVICDPKNMEVIRKRGDDPDELIDLYIDAINNSLRDRPASMSVCVHMCRGNMGHGMASGGYEPIAERMFNRLNVDGFFLEYDTPRAGDFAPLRHLPKPKKAVLGLMTTKKPEVETADSLKRRLEEATKYVDLDRLCLSPQCGFASVPIRGRGLTMDDAERKLARIVEVANDVWG